MKPQDWVAIILAVGVIVILLTGTNLRFLFMDPADYQPGSELVLQFWKDVVLVIIGALSGYIAGRTTNDQ